MKLGGAQAPLGPILATPLQLGYVITSMDVSASSLACHWKCMGSLDIWEHSKVQRIFLDEKCAFVPLSNIANLVSIASKTAKLRGVLERPTQRAHTIADS